MSSNVRWSGIRAIIAREYTSYSLWEIASYKIFPTKAAVGATVGDVWSDISAIGLFDVCWWAVEISGWLGPGPDAGLAQPLSQFEEKF